MHGQYEFSGLAMPPPPNCKATGGRLTGHDISQYLEKFADTFLTKRIRFMVEVVSISRKTAGQWSVKVLDLRRNVEEVLTFIKVVVCSGVSANLYHAIFTSLTFSQACSNPYIPLPLSPAAAKSVDFTGPVFHSAHFASELENLLFRVPQKMKDEIGSVVVVGSGRSAMECVDVPVSSTLHPNH